MTVIALVSCVKKKERLAQAARDLYCSPLFQFMRKYAEQNADEWYILSAKYGLVKPLEKIGPYELTLKTMSKHDRVVWAKKVKNQIEKENWPASSTVMFLAGTYYREYLADFLTLGMGYTITVPMKGLKLGDQLKWLKAKTSPPKMKGFGIV